VSCIQLLEPEWQSRFYRRRYFKYSVKNQSCQGCERSEHPQGLALIGLFFHATLFIRKAKRKKIYPHDIANSQIIAMGSSGRCGLIGLISFVTVQGFPDCRLSGIPGEMGIALHYREFHGDLGDIL